MFFFVSDDSSYYFDVECFLSFWEKKKKQNKNKAHFDFHSRHKSTQSFSCCPLLQFLRLKIKARQVKLEMRHLFPIRPLIRHGNALNSSFFPMSSNLLLRTGYFWENWTQKTELHIVSEELLENMRSKLQDVLKTLKESCYGDNCGLLAAYGHISDIIIIIIIIVTIIIII